MPGILSSTPADHSRFNIKWPWSTYTECPLPDETFSPDAYKEKTSLVKKIARIYEAPLNDNDHDERQFTGCQNALFYSFTPAALRAIAPFPEDVKYIGGIAEHFGTLFFPGNNAEISASQKKVEKDHPMPRSICKSVNQRDFKTCLVTGTRGIDHTRIVPLLVTVLDDKGFNPCYDLGKRYFKHDFRSFLKARIQSLHDSGDRKYNILSLRPDIRQLFDKGLVGFKPLYVEATRSGHLVNYYASFSFHVLGRNRINSHERVLPSDATLYQMLSPCEQAKLTDTEIFALDKCIAHDGKVIRVPCDQRDVAEKMLALLAFRWIASSYWYLAGSPGSQLDGDMAQDKDLGQDGHPGQNDGTRARSRSTSL